VGQYQDGDIVNLKKLSGGSVRVRGADIAMVWRAFTYCERMIGQQAGLQVDMLRCVRRI